MWFKNGRCHLCDRLLQLRCNQNRPDLYPARSRRDCFESTTGACYLRFPNICWLDSTALVVLIIDVCERHGLKLLTYGTLMSCDRFCKFTQSVWLTLWCQCGGFFGWQVLGALEPDSYADNLTPSQRKVHITILRLGLLHKFFFPMHSISSLDMIAKAWGSWGLFQSLLSVLRIIGDRHGKSYHCNTLGSFFCRCCHHW